MPYAMLVSSSVMPPNQHVTHLLHGSNPVVGGIIAAVLTVGGTASWLYMRSRRPTAEELERRRRDHLATTGRITDGILIDARTLGGE